MWSESGGRIKPAVMSMFVSVVSVTSMRVLELWDGSCRVGRVIVVWFSMRRWKKRLDVLRPSRSRFYVSLDGDGCFVCVW